MVDKASGLSKSSSMGLNINPPWATTFGHDGTPAKVAVGSLQFPLLVFLQGLNLPFPGKDSGLLHGHPQVPAFLVVPVKDNLLPGKVPGKSEGAAVPEINLGDDPPLAPIGVEVLLQSFLDLRYFNGRAHNASFPGRPKAGRPFCGSLTTRAGHKGRQPRSPGRHAGKSR